MQRKQFISLLAPLTVAMSTVKASASLSERSRKFKVPPYLQPGDLIGVTCPAGQISTEDVMPAVREMEKWGLRVRIGATVGQRDHALGGTDDERATDLQYMLDDPGIKAIMCARGGYGVVRIIDRLNFDGFKASPKWVIGFSDITVLHEHIHQNLRYATLHSKMCNSFPSDMAKADAIQIDTIASIQQALVGKPMSYTAPAAAGNRFGKATGALIGGNLTIVASMTGTHSDIDTKGKILFLEDTGEYLYNIDRMMYNLLRSGKLDHLAGLIIGGFKLKPEEGDEFGKDLVTIVTEKTEKFDYPVCFDFPVGHQRNNFALKCGVLHQFEVSASGTTLRSLS
ncbi:LD-carboxypeptidase [Mucilaginibacter daejeonensis]|uniref:S66 peptidase family protein n=1 Tax=Mucilaginibacter daejeonensis TaxID=398049 RepID=UPI001D171C1F|nr:LD-carboxypeptidase [Mucilaginibacter daejeonensis]UEG51640.1 LD-carboxypeptidase [Mucilaginibacter daejeonensis]